MSALQRPVAAVAPIEPFIKDTVALSEKIKAIDAVGGAVVVGEEVGRLEFTDPARNDFSLSVVYPDGFKQEVAPQQVKVPESEEKTGSVSTLRNLGVRHGFAAWLGRHTDQFPRLERKDWEALSPATDDYNCIALSLGETDHNVWPGPLIEDFDKLYAEHGFVPLDGLDYTLQPEVEKAVLFAQSPGDRDYEPARLALEAEGKPVTPGTVICTHAIRQETDGSYSSKNGALARIKVLDPRDLGGGLYGEPIRVYARKRETTPQEAQ
jgi:hypothetical protein